jgi:hypothetical protein
MFARESTPVIGKEKKRKENKTAGLSKKREYTRMRKESERKRKRAIACQ